MNTESETQQQSGNSKVDFANSMKSEAENRGVEISQAEASRSHDYTNLKYRSTAYLANDKLATGLGIFSLALGLAEVFIPTKLGEMTGLEEKHRKLLPLFGLREIASGVAILRAGDPTAAVWSRVGGDAMDLAFLGSALVDSPNKLKVSAAIAAVAGVTAVDAICARKLGEVTAQAPSDIMTTAAAG